MADPRTWRQRLAMGLVWLAGRVSPSDGVLYVSGGIVFRHGRGLYVAGGEPLLAQNVVVDDTRG